jgi:dTDP-4-dehydrorhamnose 3,5-epimerase
VATHSPTQPIGLPLKITELAIPGVLLLELDQHQDDRGWFLEFWNPNRMSHPDLPQRFVQDNIAFSRRAVLRGLHYQEPNPQGKLVTVAAGEIFDVAVDLRAGSTTFGQWEACRLTAARALYVPAGFAHGYLVLSEGAHVLYKCTAYYDGAAEHSLAWNDPELAIDWPNPTPVLSAKDAAAPSLADTRRARGR